MSEVERIRLVRDGRQFRVEPAMPDELFIDDEYGSVWLVKGTDYDAETARSDRAVEELAKAKSTTASYFALVKTRTEERDRAEAGCVAFADAMLCECEDEYGNRLPSAPCLKHQPHPGSRFLDLAQIVEGLPKYGPVKTYAGFTNNVKVYGLLLDDKEATIEQYRELADALARLLAWRGSEERPA